MDKRLVAQGCCTRSPTPFSAPFRFHSRLTTCDSSQDSPRPFRSLQLSPHSGRSGISSPLILSLSYSLYVSHFVYPSHHSHPLHINSSPPTPSIKIFVHYVCTCLGNLALRLHAASMPPPLSIHMHNPLIRHPFPTTCIACSCTIRSQIPHRHMYMSVSAVA